MINYKFSAPMKINFEIDDSMISIESIDDIKDIQDKYDIDLEYIIDEYEYKLDSINDMDDDDDDYYGVTENNLFDDIISDNWDSIIKKINKRQGTNLFSDEQIELMFRYTKDSFEKYILSEKYNEKIEKIELTSFNKTNDEFYINVTTHTDLDSKEIKEIKNWLDIQMIEKWGDSLSKTDLSDKIDMDDMYVYIIPWSTKKDIKYIK